MLDFIWNSRLLAFIWYSRLELNFGTRDFLFYWVKRACSYSFDMSNRFYCFIYRCLNMLLLVDRWRTIKVLSFPNDFSYGLIVIQITISQHQILLYWPDSKVYNGNEINHPVTKKKIYSNIIFYIVRRMNVPVTDLFSCMEFRKL